MKTHKELELELQLANQKLAKMTTAVKQLGAKLKAIKKQPCNNSF